MTVKHIDDEGTISYTQIPKRKTKIVVKQDPRDYKRGTPEGHWYVFRLSPKTVITVYEGRKAECIKHAEELVKYLEGKR